MDEIKKSMMLQDTIIGYLTQIQRENNIPTLMMESVIYKYLSILNEQKLRDIFIEESEVENGGNSVEELG